MKGTTEHWTPPPPYTDGQVIQSDLPVVDPYTFQPTGQLQRFRVRVQPDGRGYDLTPVKDGEV